MRQAHMLRPTKRITRPRRIIFAAHESWARIINDHTTRHTLRLGYAAHYRYVPGRGLEYWREITYWRELDFWRWVDRQCTAKTTTYLCAENLVLALTLTAAFERLAKMGWTLDNLYCNDGTDIMRWSREGRKLIGLSLSNFYGSHVSNLGDRLGLVPLIERDYESKEAYLIAAAKRRVEILAAGWGLWIEFLDRHDLGSFRWTAGATSFAAWRHRFLHRPIHIHDNRYALSLERAAYRGGRNECFFVGTLDESAYYYLDINSMYGHILASREFPGGLWGASRGGSLYALRYKLDRYCVVARCALSVTESVYPIKHEGHTCYPLGEMITTLCTPELVYALERGWIKEVYAMAWYRKERLFADYALFLRQLREQYEQDDDAVFAAIAKKLLNSFYGKFGQYKLRQESVGKCDHRIYRREQIYDMEDGTYYDWIWLGGEIIRECQDGESYNSFPAIAAHVTAHARMYLYYLMRQVPRGHLYYVDTDGLIVDQVGFDALRYYIDPTTMGMLGIDAVSPWLIINAPKDYAMQSRARKKGISRDAIQIAPDVYEMSTLPGLATVLNKGLSGEYDVETITKTRLRGIYSGRLGADGWIRPFVFAAGEVVGDVHLWQVPALV